MPARSPRQERAMSKSITIHLTDEQYEAVRAAAERAKQSPEKLVAATVAARFGDNGSTGQTTRPAQDPLIQFMRERGHLVDPKDFPPYPQPTDMPPYGTPEWDAMLEEIGEELSDAAERMGIDLGNLADLIER
jgi:hypothetical protein